MTCRHRLFRLKLPACVCFVFTVLVRIEESSREYSAALWEYSIGRREMGELNFRFVFLGFIGSVHSQCCIKQGSTGRGKISLLIECLLEIAAIAHTSWVKMKMEGAMSQTIMMQNNDNQRINRKK